ncbi:hypothetical protein, partial [Plasmodium yoelii yoelii]
ILHHHIYNNEQNISDLFKIYIPFKLGPINLQH